jgi:hypothetical protein
MTAHAVHRSPVHQSAAHPPAPPRNAAHRARARRRKHGVFTWPFALTVLLVASATTFISYVLWPTWPSDPVAFDAPALPITIAGVLFEIPPAAIRETVQCHPGEHERVDLTFIWPSLTPPQADNTSDRKSPLRADNAIAAATELEAERLFVTIEGLNGVLPPLERLRTIYPRYVETQASTGPDGLATLPFRSGTPYDGSVERALVDAGARHGAILAGAAREKLFGTAGAVDQIFAEIAMRFPRGWLIDWRDVAAGLDRLAGQLHPETK